MRIGIITQWWPPEPASYIPHDLAHGLAARGHSVKVITGFPNYPDGVIYAGYRQRWKEEFGEEGVTVRRVPLYASHDSSAARRAANYLSFASTSTVAAMRLFADVDVVYTYLTPATAAAAGTLLRTLRGIPSVIHVQDLWPETVTASAMMSGGRAGAIADSLLHRAMRQLYRRSTAIAVIAPTMRDLVVARGADPASTRVILNWTDEALFRSVPRTEEARVAIGARDRCILMYAGTMGPLQNIADSVRAADAVRGLADLVLIGSGIALNEARRIAAELRADNIRFLDRRPASEMAPLYAAADYQLVTLRNMPIFHGTIPSKLQAALACGSPVVTSVPGDCADFVGQHGVGFSSVPDDWQALAERFRQAASVPPGEHAQMARRAAEAYRTHMSRTAGIDQVEDMLTSAAKSRRTPR
jgi:colanic acid biosynthesis glycosyl transferase WcaI